MKNRFSAIALLISALFIIGVTLVKPRYLMPQTEATLAWDISGYYLYLPAIFIYKDLKKLEFLPGIIEKYRPSTAPDQAFPYSNDGTQVMKYPAGMALLYLPFFLIGHLAATMTGFAADGFSLPYQAAIHLGSLLVAILGLFFLRKNLLRFFSDKIVGWALLLVALGTNWLNYATFDAAMPHVYLFTVLSVLVYVTIRWHDRPNWRDSFWLGLSIGLAGLVRPTEVLFALVPVLWGIKGAASAISKTQLLLKNLPKLLLAGAVVAAVGFIQLAYWKMTTGEWLVYSYQDQGFSFLHPHFSDVFFSYRKGWFVYTPLMLFAVAGFFFLAKNSGSPPAPPRRGGELSPGLMANSVKNGGTRFGNPSSSLSYRSRGGVFFPIFLFFLLNTWVVCAWDIWWYGGAFGQRAMIQSYALLAFPLAAFMEWVSQKKWLSLAFGLIAGSCAALNLFQTYQAHWGPFETDMMNRAYYWRVFANTKNDPYDRLLLDTNEGFSGERKNARPVLAEDFEQWPDSSGVSRRFARSGVYSAFVAPSVVYSPPVEFKPSPDLKPGGWLHVSAWFYSDRPEWETWWMPQMVVAFEKEGKRVKENPVRPFRVYRQNEWWEVSMDIRLPEKDWEVAKIFLWNPRESSEMFMDDLQVEAFERY